MPLDIYEIEDMECLFLNKTVFTINVGDKVLECLVNYRYLTKESGSKSWFIFIRNSHHISTVDELLKLVSMTRNDYILTYGIKDKAHEKKGTFPWSTKEGLTAFLELLRDRDSKLKVTKFNSFITIRKVG